ncbi:hypothetical protein C0216_21455 [Streptomyces globosus]|uniref:Uncharacterized protein n=1 Tax=Streptomyces globosus TaxID=68209 RepID=A0A344U453_9ACTN|nr:hypothetical protein C0216_21455 [Streptomyces globosus]
MRDGAGRQGWPEGPSRSDATNGSALDGPPRPALTLDWRPATSHHPDPDQPPTPPRPPPPRTAPRPHPDPGPAPAPALPRTPTPRYPPVASCRP